MKTTKEEYLDILQSAKNYIFEQINPEHEEGRPRWVVSELESYNYFKNLAIQNKQKSVTHCEKIVEVPVQKMTPIYTAPIKAIQVTETTPVVQASKAVEVKSLPEESKTKQPLELHAMGIAPLQDLSDIRKVVEKVLPNEIILDHIPTSNPEILIISNTSNTFYEALLVNFARAIDICIARARFIPSKKYKAANFPSLKMVIQSGEDPTIELPAFIRLLKINSISELFDKPELKQKLWDETKHVFFS